MAIKKSELYTSLWASCDELRGGMDASQYKDYVLVLLFVKYISDKYQGMPYAPITVPKGASFKDMVALKGKPDIGDQINKKIIGAIAKANGLEGTIDVADFNNADKLGSGKEMVDRLTKLVAIFENPALDFSKNRAEGDDILGDAYEFLMRHFATESGKSKGQFYTPAEVSRILAKTIGIGEQKTTSSTTVYDPTCGSGSLLLKVADEADTKVSLFGQEKDVATAALAKMNMILHDNATAEIKKGQSTLSDPLFLDGQGRLQTYNYVVANPPFSFKAWTTGFAVQKGTITDPHDRFRDYGVPPQKNGDYSFLLHIIRSMKANKGKGAVILPHGVLFRGNVEAEIRKNIIRRGYIKGIIGLPANLFYGTGIPACVIVLDKENADNRKGIFIIDASKGFMKDGNKNRLRAQDIHKIVEVFNRQLKVEKYSRMVSIAEIEKNEFNLNIPRYIDSQDEEDIQDIEAHLHGGIPNRDIDALREYWETYPKLRRKLFAGTDRKNYSQLTVAHDEIKQAIFEHGEFIDYTATVQTVYDGWAKPNRKKLNSIAVGDKPKKLIHEISEDLLKRFSEVALIDKYDMYQHLMEYWAETMQDDVYELVVDGWDSGKMIEYKTDKKGKQAKEWEGRLIPKELVIDRYFEKEKKAIEALQAKSDDLGRQMEELEEEHSGEEGLLEEARNDKGKLNKKGVADRIKEIKDDPDSKEEFAILKKYQKLLDEQAKVNKEIKVEETALEKKVLTKYKVLTIDEIKVLIIDDKWLARIERDVQGEMQRISQRLTGRIKELAERYESPLPDLEDDVKKQEKKVRGHLEKMGFAL